MMLVELASRRYSPDICYVLRRKSYLGDCYVEYVYAIEGSCDFILDRSSAFFGDCRAGLSQHNSSLFASRYHMNMFNR